MNKIYTALFVMALSIPVADGQETRHSVGKQLTREHSVRIFEAFSLSDGVLFESDFPMQAAGDVVELDVPITGKSYTLQLESHSVRSTGFSVFTYGNDGEGKMYAVQASRLVKGEVRGLVGSRVIGSLLNARFTGKIVLPNGQVFFIEPVVKKLKGLDSGLHVVYQLRDVIAGEGHCVLLDAEAGQRSLARRSFGVTQAFDREAAQGTVNPRGGFGNNQVCELAVDADVEYFLSYGSEQATIDRIELIVAIVNDQYDDQVDIIHEITSINVRTSEPDPYTATDYLGVISDIQDEWINNQAGVERDVAHLFTGKEIDGNIIGAAFIGAICDVRRGYGFSQSDFNGSLACATDLTAHEFGHNWDANHCDCNENTMNPSITCANDFTVDTINAIMSFRDSLDCLEFESGVLLGDVNLDGVVNLLDVGPFIAVISGGSFQAEADTNQDGIVNLLDVASFIQILGG